MSKSATKPILKSAVAFIVQLVTYIALYAAAGMLFFNNDMGPTANTSWYLFILIAIISNGIDKLLYFQVLIWALVCKFTYNAAFAPQSIAIMCIGFIAIATNILTRTKATKQ